MLKKNLSFYNSLSHQVEPFIPNIPGQVSLYCCGVTVYDHCHIGHGRIFVTNDLLLRLFQLEGYRCLFIRNITDIDDKILNRADELKVLWSDLAETYTQSMQALCVQLGCLPVHLEPKATESIPQIIEMIQTLVAKGHAYIIDREVFFSVETFSTYGQLSNQDRESLEAGQRVAIADHKRHPHDFTLWKPSLETQAGWDSPWGRGRPGWHIECSAMIAAHVNGSLDFHMGGMDLKFPHHENEIAQSECCYNHPLSTGWLHVGFVTVDGEKMSKSLNNFKYLSEFMDIVSPAVTRYLYLATHYRQPIALSQDSIRSAQGSLRSLGQVLGPYKQKIQAMVDKPQVDADLFERLMAPCREDLNIPQSLSVLHAEVKDLVHLSGEQALGVAHTILLWGEQLLGLDFSVLYSEILPITQAPQFLQALAQSRQEARAEKNYAVSDQIRAQIMEAGFELIDTPDGLLFKALK